MEQVIDLQNHPHLMPIALTISEDLAGQLGYKGHSGYVMFHLSSDGDALMWFDGALGTLGHIDAWNNWVAEKAVRMALRGITWHQNIAGESFVLLVDRFNQALYVGELNRVRNLLIDLIQAQAFEDPVVKLLDDVGVDPDAMDEVTPESLRRLFGKLRQGVQVSNKTIH